VRIGGTPRLAPKKSEKSKKRRKKPFLKNLLKPLKPINFYLTPPNAHTRDKHTTPRKEKNQI
jgi:hypothetical protein